jgi:endonuclease III
MDRQIRAELAWIIPYEISKRLGSFEFSHIASLSLSDVEQVMHEPEPLHRFPEAMSRNLYEAIQTIKDSYNGYAANIWLGEPSSAEIVYRFLQFRGIGPKIATMTANILAREFKIRMKDYYSIDISVDVHVRRVFGRLGLAREGASNEELIYKARAINPEFPGLIDLPLWEIGRTWCKTKHPNCDQCYMNGLCPKAKTDN